MEYVYKSANVIDYRKGKDKQKDVSPILDLIKVPKMQKSTAYEHKEKIISFCEECKDKLTFLYSHLRSAEDDEKDVIYERIKQTKEERNEKVKELLSEEYVLYLVLKEYENPTSENWHLYAPLLQSDLFKNMLKESKEKMFSVVEKDCGEYDLYGLKFTKN